MDPSDIRVVREGGGVAVTYRGKEVHPGDLVDARGVSAGLAVLADWARGLVAADADDLKLWLARSSQQVTSKEIGAVYGVTDRRMVVKARSVGIKPAVQTGRGFLWRIADVPAMKPLPRGRPRRDESVS